MHLNPVLSVYVPGVSPDPVLHSPRGLYGLYITVRLYTVLGPGGRRVYPEVGRCTWEVPRSHPPPHPVVPGV